MSIVTDLASKLRLVGAIPDKITSAKTKLQLLSAFILPANPGVERDWFSAASAEEFRNKYVTTKAYVQSHARLPIAR
jgi:hypothetical protein